MEVYMLTAEAVREFFAQSQHSPESICLELSQVRDQIVLNYPKENPAESLIATYTALMELEELVRELASIASLPSAPPDPHGHRPSSS